jgi:hypothetical protein
MLCKAMHFTVRNQEFVGMNFQRKKNQIFSGKKPSWQMQLFNFLRKKQKSLWRAINPGKIYGVNTP